jgi:hypothetical protein
MNCIFVPWLHMHQPPIWSPDKEPPYWGNLEKMLNAEPNSEEAWNAQWFAQAYKNPAAYAEKLSNEGYSPRMMVDYSGILLEELAHLSQNGTFANLHVNDEPIGDVIELWRRVLDTYPDAIEFAGTAYSHCYFPTTPERDWEAQIQQWRRVFADLFGEKALARVRGFWLPEMGMMGESPAALRLIRLLKQYGYEWLILPHSALQYPPEWHTAEVENRLHWLVVEANGERDRILCVVRDTEMGIRQQSGQNADGCLDDIRDRASKLTSDDVETPPLVVPTSDGENGNVMMFEYFPNTFEPLVRQAASLSDVTLATVSEYIDRYQGDPTDEPTEVRLREAGGSWIGSHESWEKGDRRQQVSAAIDKLSADFAQAMAENKLSPEQSHAARQALLLCETSCFVYWNQSFWFDQAEYFLDWARGKLQV